MFYYGENKKVINEKSALAWKFALVCVWAPNKRSRTTKVFFSSWIKMEQTGKMQENAAFFAMCNKERWFCNKIAHSVCLCVFYRAVMRVPKVNIFKSEQKYITTSKNETKDVGFFVLLCSALHRKWNDFTEGGKSSWATIKCRSLSKMMLSWWVGGWVGGCACAAVPLLLLHVKKNMKKRATESESRLFIALFLRFLNIEKWRKKVWMHMKICGGWKNIHRI